MFDWSKYAVGGAKRPDSFTGLNPDFSTALSQMLLAAEADLGPNALSITSAYRSPEKQAELYEAALKKYGSPAAARKWVAPPGRSMHNKGLAVDFGAAGGGLLRDPNSREAQWLKANATKFGLDVPMSWEPWQVELAGAREGKKIAAETMSLLGKGPQTSTKGPQMMQEQKPQGLLGSLGIQKMEEGAEGETGQRFYNRDSFKDTAAVLAQGFGRMGIMGMEEIADSVAKQRTESKARNKTAEYLRKAGRTDLADMVDQGLIGGREAASVLMQKPATGEIREIDNKLVRVMPDGSVIELYASDSPADLTADMREYNLAKEQGFTGSFIEFIQAQKGGGLQIRTNPDGTTEIIQGGPAGTKLTEGQSKATGFFARSDEANKIMADLEQEGTELRNAISGALPFGNYMRTAEGQKYDQAKRNFINAILRQESGAAIGPSEFASAELQYFPQPGDSPEVIAQKKANRATAVSALKVSAGPGAEAIGAPAPTGGGATADPLGLRN